MFILLANSVKNTTQVFIILKISYYPPFRLFIIEDSGEGIFKSKFGQIFSDNYQLNFDEDIGLSEHMGFDKRPLGLNTIQKLIKSMKSYFSVESNEDKKGTIITFALNIKLSYQEKVSFKVCNSPEETSEILRVQFF